MKAVKEERRIGGPDERTVFVVSGGAKGITASCVIELAQRYHSRFVLVGRSDYDDAPDPTWARGVEEERDLRRRAMEHLRARGEAPDPKTVRSMARNVRSRREIARTLNDVRDAGGLAVYAQADVTDGPGLRDAVSEALDRLGMSAIHGVIHGAGVIADRRIEEKTADDFERVYGVKVDGLKNLLAAVEIEALRYVVLFTSVAGFYGNAGQADYALANAVLDKAAHWLAARAPDCRVLAMDWGPWDGGMVTPALKRMMERRGIELIPIPSGAAALAEALNSRSSLPVQQVVGASLAGRPQPKTSGPAEPRREPYQIDRTLALDANPFLRDHVIGGRAVLPTVCAVAWMINTCEQLYPGYDFFRVSDYKVYKGLVFDETLAPVHRLTIQEMDAEPDSEAAVRVLDARITSETEGGLDRNHYGARITLRRDRPDPGDSAALQTAERNPIAGDRLYQEGVLFHGPSFQGVERVLHMDEGGLIARCRLAPISPEAQGQFPVRTFNPYLADVQLQSLLVWATETYGYGGLPLKIRESTYYHNPAFGEETYASMTVRSHTEHRLVADVAVFSAEGQLYSRVRGAEITLSPRLNRLFADNQLGGAA